ncbi:hypothetical protein ACL2XP_23130 [Sodalis sp. RH21]|uniref:hypothetical protein n=1 Tax=unclassified Sodalis (in: enterobacteria) TaxID=2636512 RepID=UPI0039B5195B
MEKEDLAEKGIIQVSMKIRKDLITGNFIFFRRGELGLFLREEKKRLRRENTQTLLKREIIDGF